MEDSTSLPAELQGLSEEAFFGNECYRTLYDEYRKAILHTF